MADITLTFAKGSLTPSVSAVGRAAAIAVEFSGYADYIHQNAYGETGILYVDQNDAVGKVISRTAITDFSDIEITLAGGCASLGFEFAASSKNGSGPAPIKSFPVAITAPAEVPAFDADDEGKVLTIVVDDEVASAEWTLPEATIL